MTRILFLPDPKTVLLYQSDLPAVQLAQRVNEGNWVLPQARQPIPLQAGNVLKAAVLNADNVAILPIDQKATWAFEMAQLSLFQHARSAEEPELSFASLRLTEREREILAYLAKGLSNKEISKLMGIHRNTTDYHISKLKKRLGTNNLLQSLRRAAELGLYQPKE